MTLRTGRVEPSSSMCWPLSMPATMFVHPSGEYRRIPRWRASTSVESSEAMVELLLNVIRPAVASAESRFSCLTRSLAKPVNCHDEAARVDPLARSREQRFGLGH